MRRLALAALLALTACAADRDLAEPVEPLGAFRLGHAIVVTSAIRKVQPSRHIEPEAWEAAMKEALERRFGRYEGDRFYHLAVSVEGYSVAVTGVPLVVAPKSVLSLGVTVWDDRTGKINAEPKEIVVFETFDGRSFLGSGLTMRRDEQVEQLATNAAKKIEDWLRENPEWFAPRPGPDAGLESGPASQ